MRIADAHLERVLAGTDYLVFDGAMGTMLQARGLEAGALPELLCLERPEEVEAIHRAYLDAGAEAITTNTFGANARKLGDAASVEEVFAAAIGCARRAGARYVAADIGPTGALLRPLGTLDFDDAYELFAEQARAAEAHGADLILIETMADLLETKAAVLAARENSELPVFATMTFGEDGRTFLGTSPEVAAVTLSGLGVSALGINCSLGPDALLPLVERMAPLARVPLMCQANAGLPRVEGERTVYDVSPDDYAAAAKRLLDAGVTVIGGCCGTNPDYIVRVAALLAGRVPTRELSEPEFCVSSAQRVVTLAEAGHDIAVIGERLNPTGKRKMKEALRSGNYDYLVGEAIAQREAGADILDVNVGLPELDEPVVLPEVVERVQAVCDLPLQVDSTDVAAVERAVRRYAGKPMVNSVNGKADNLAAVLPVVARYGCAVVGLTLDERGIPATGDERFEIARRIVEAAESYGIPRADVAIDCLAMAASTNQAQVPELLHAIRRVKAELGCHCVLGVSNISFGLPQRELLNAVFLSEAFGAGLDLPIINPLPQRMRDVVAGARVMNAQDAGATRFIEGYASTPSPYAVAAGAAVPAAAGAGAGSGSGSGVATQAAPASDAPSADDADPATRARALILSGRKGPMGDVTRELLVTKEPLEVVNEVLMPALDEVGDKFERGEFFLPQLMASAEAAKAGFDAVHDAAPAATGESKGDVALATVHGDIHDIGKNIVKMLLENYGYHVYDLGRDVPPDAVVRCCLDHDVRFVGLSALMTTTVRGMEDTISLLREQVPGCEVVVGGAVLNPEYAEMVGANHYAKDAAETVRLAGEFFAAR